MSEMEESSYSVSEETPGMKSSPDIGLVQTDAPAIAAAPAEEYELLPTGENDMTTCRCGGG